MLFQPFEYQQLIILPSEMLSNHRHVLHKIKRPTGYKTQDCQPVTKDVCFINNHYALSVSHEQS